MHVFITKTGVVYQGQGQRVERHANTHVKESTLSLVCTGQSAKVFYYKWSSASLIVCFMKRAWYRTCEIIHADPSVALSFQLCSSFIRRLLKEHMCSFTFRYGTEGAVQHKPSPRRRKRAMFHLLGLQKAVEVFKTFNPNLWTGLIQ